MAGASEDSADHFGRQTIDLPSSIDIRFGDEVVDAMVLSKKARGGKFLRVETDFGMRDGAAGLVLDQTADTFRSYQLDDMRIRQLVSLIQFPTHSHVCVTF